MFKKMLVAAALVLVAPSASAQLVGEVRVNVAPPVMRTEVIAARPSAGHVWIPGYWAWRGNQHVWMGGHWAMAPNSGMVWEPARWENRGGAWFFVEGHWRWNAAPTTVYMPPAAPAQQIVVQAAPPAPIMEVRPQTVIQNAVWIPGYWHWNGFHHVWVGGHWSAPRTGWVWEPAHWQQTPGGWQHIPGHWRQ